MREIIEARQKALYSKLDNKIDSMLQPHSCIHEQIALLESILVEGNQKVSSSMEDVV